MKLSIIIKALNEGANIARAIESAITVANQHGGEVILADSGSTDQTLEIASRYPIKIVQVADPRQARCGAGPQLGYQYAQGDFIHMMDGDMELSAEFVAKALQVLAADPRLAGVGGHIREMREANLIFKARAKRSQEQRAQVAHDVVCLGGGGLYRATALHSVGYMSDRNLHGFEEYDLGRRLLSHGWRLLALPDRATDHYSYALSTGEMLFHRLRGGAFLGQGEVLRAAAECGYLLDVPRDFFVIRLSLGVLAAWLIGVLALLALPAPGVIAALGLAAIAVLATVVGWKHQSLASGWHSVLIWHLGAAGLVAGALRPRIPPQMPIESLLLQEADECGPADSPSVKVAASGKSQSVHTINGGTRVSAPFLGSKRDQTPIRVLIATPLGAQGKGGMDRMTDLMVGHFESGQPGVSVERLTTKGGRGKVWGALVYLKAVSRLLALGLFGRIDVFHVNMAAYGSFYRKGFLCLIARALGIPYVVHIHTGVFGKFWNGSPRLIKSAINACLQKAEKIVVLGRTFEALVLANLPDVKDKIVTLPNATPAREQASAKSLPHANKHITFVGVFIPLKGLPILVQALAKLKSRGDWTATFAGEGAIGDVMALAHELSIADRIVCPGWLSPEDVGDLLDDTDIFVLPSFSEGLPLVILEAFSSGAAVVATRVGAVSDVVDHGRNGLIVSPGSVDELSSAIERLLDDDSYRQALALAGQRDHALHFEVGSYMERIMGIWTRKPLPSSSPSAKPSPEPAPLQRQA